MLFNFKKHLFHKLLKSINFKLIRRERNNFSTNDKKKIII